MAKQDQGSENPFDFGLENLDIQDTLSKSERFLEKYKQLLIGVFGGLVVVIGLVYYINGVYLPNQQEEAQNLMFVAERYFENDSLNLAVNGDGNFPGFVEIADDYGWTRAGKLAHYYAGISYLRMEQFEDAIEHLKKFSTNEPIIGSIALGATGDAYLELGDQDKALDYYLKAASKEENDFTTPVYLMRAGELAESLGNKKKALELYEQILADYKSTTEGQAVEKYIARLNASK
jgi:tetratricopeptide (TPR) repeat protein